MEYMPVFARIRVAEIVDSNKTELDANSCYQIHQIEWKLGRSTKPQLHPAP